MIAGDFVSLAHDAVVSYFVSIVSQTDLGQKMIVFQRSGGVCRTIMRLCQNRHFHDYFCAGYPDECLAQKKPERIMSAEDLVHGQSVVEQQRPCLTKLFISG